MLLLSFFTPAATLSARRKSVRLRSSFVFLNTVFGVTCSTNPIVVFLWQSLETKKLFLLTRGNFNISKLSRRERTWLDYLALKWVCYCCQPNPPFMRAFYNPFSFLREMVHLCWPWPSRWCPVLGHLHKGRTACSRQSWPPADRHHCGRKWPSKSFMKNHVELWALFKSSHCAMSILTRPACPQVAAAWSGVHSSLSWALTPAPRSSRIFTISS